MPGVWAAEDEEVKEGGKMTPPRAFLVDLAQRLRFTWITIDHLELMCKPLWDRWQVVDRREEEKYFDEKGDIQG